ncbi:MAG TPA: TIGR03435 family protein [Bryobacteraceae bacterium]|nr:TIGR03435 family protein [Bryobacteraceae bacterium]
MTIATRTLAAAALGAACLFAQKFEFADVKASPKMPGQQFARGSTVRNGRFEMTNASMVDLIRLAYGMDPDRITGGPSWVEMDRFDVVAKVPDGADREAQSAMMKALLADRFRLVVHEDKTPMPGYALRAGKKPSMKPGDGSGDTGCRIQQRDAAPGPGAGMLMTSINGQVTRIALGPGATIDYVCRNITMESFVDSMRTMIGAGVGNKAVLNETELDGKWDFSLHFSLGFGGAIGGEDRISFQDAVEKQLGLKLADITVPTQVIVIDSVERKPTPNPPGTAEALPPLKSTAVFDVATIRPSDPAAFGGSSNWNRNRYTAQNLSLGSLVMQAFRAGNVPMLNRDALVGLPGFADNVRYDISATTSSPDGIQDTGPMLRGLLEDRFRMKWHNEDRPMDAYRLVAVKPRMKKADPASRSHCIRANGPAGSPPGTQTMTCQNMTMDDFVDQLMGAGPGLNWPVHNSTGLEGGWDFTLTYGRGAVPTPMAAGPLPAGGGEGHAGAVGEASDPGGTLTLFEAVEKQLGLKLEIQRRPEPVVVIDRLEQTPTEN